MSNFTKDDEKDISTLKDIAKYLAQLSKFEEYSGSFCAVDNATHEMMCVLRSIEVRNKINTKNPITEGDDATKYETKYSDSDEISKSITNTINDYEELLKRDEEDKKEEEENEDDDNEDDYEEECEGEEEVCEEEEGGEEDE